MRYITIEDHFLLNAYRHECRGLNWIELGYDDRTAGSFRKAIKNYNKAKEFDFSSLLDKPCEIIMKMISNSVLNGSSNG